MKILLTGFDPFGGEALNPSWEAVRRAACSSAELIRAQIPTSYRRAPERLRALCAEHRPDIVLCVGQAGGRSGPTPERRAVNRMGASIPDNDGVLLRDTPILAEGESALYSTLPAERLAEALRGRGLPASVSDSAGTFVCNRLMYEALLLGRTEYPGMRAGFVHLPFLPEQTAGKRPEPPSMPLEKMVLSLNIILEVLEEQST